MNIINQIDFKKLFNLGYIFESSPASIGLYKYLAILFSLMIIGAVVIFFFNRKDKDNYKKLKNNFFNLFLTTGIIGVVLIFLRWQEVPYLGSRAMLLILLVAFIIWSFLIGYYGFFVLPKEIIKIKEKEHFEKYLPHKRKA
ncbi:hypothetical protein A2V71_03725 [Candidatus Berkelbacteria bacterium RBG_13_40_8]|uniref:Uncharacterized protein n=1 Tax=Candidatus Berkelbacteria bacterium RBG_13_40_8 TaxID=1797467 RepID=A0A1F5DN21_9BACT|nr:MAG: hypothetical protein A2V71_03725 [Candidatus Berkelbacteria bacterium RBG_13_40_8]